MHFASMKMAHLLWLLPLVFLFFSYADRNRKKAMEAFADRDVLPNISGTLNPAGRKAKHYISAVIILFIILTLMRPQWGFKWQEVKKEGIDILIALDASKSMLAEDVLPNRLERSKLAIKDLVKKLKSDRIGLIAFSGTAFLQCPLTVDYNGFLLALNDVDVDTIPVGGTSIANAIYKAIDSYKEGGHSKNKILIIITDGEDLEGGLDRAIAKAKLEGIHISCIGVGSKEGELIPIKDGSGKMSFLKDRQGNVVKTRLDEGPLKKIVAATDGMYVKASGTDFGLDLIYADKLAKLQKEEIKSRMRKQFYERFQIFLMFALVLLLLEPFIGNRKREKR